MALFLCAHRPDAPAQLAITEVMSLGSTNGLGLGSLRPDFWELTNFGTNEVSLEGYRWFDKDDVTAEGRKSFPATTLTPGESIIVIRGGNSVVSDSNAFRAWWGPALPVNLQIYFSPSPSPGFDAEDDAVRLWDAEGNLVDEVRFGKASMGITFTYDTNSGAFSERSEQGVAGAFRAAIGGDVGSPGYATKGPVALGITQHPISQTVDPGSEVILKVQASGRPAPQYHWSSNGISVQTAGLNPSAVPRLVCFADCGPSWRRAPGPNDLMLSGIQPGQSGDYSVAVFNGLQSLTSAVATVTVKTNPSPIQVECPPVETCVPCSGNTAPAHLVASPGQTAIFTVRNRGFPLPDFQWSRSADGMNFTDLPGETKRDLVLSNIQNADAGSYRVRLQNSNGTAHAFARLTIKPSPRLEITEVMAWACSALDRDWWELTNTNGEPVNLCGYRWDDETARVGDVYTIGGGPTITNDVIIQPGESVILLESQTAESFVQWWGASNLPPNLRFVTYAANGLGELGDKIFLWDPNETDGLKNIDSVAFGPANWGATQWFDSVRAALPEGCDGAGLGVASVNGECGAFQAGQDCEIGSPGWTRWTPPTLTSVRREGLGIAISWSAQPGSANRVEFARQLAVPLEATVWEELETSQSSWAACVATDSTIGIEPQRFYRVVRVAVADCPCPDPQIDLGL